LYLYQAHIPPYTFGNRENHDPMRPRKLLLNRREIKQIDLALAQKGYTLVPLKLYFKMGRVKVELGLGKGKKLHDKRTTIQDRETKIKLDRIRKGDRNEA
jgi:SsrA-binding protein